MIMMKGYEQKKYPVATKRYVQWLELESDEEAIREYRRLHSEGVQWKEIRDGIRQGIGVMPVVVHESSAMPSPTEASLPSAMVSI